MISNQNSMGPEIYQSENTRAAAYVIASRNFENAQKIVKDYLGKIKEMYNSFCSNYGESQNLRPSYQI